MDLDNYLWSRFYHLATLFISASMAVVVVVQERNAGIQGRWVHDK
jgi:hypothetical protein